MKKTTINLCFAVIIFAVIVTVWVIFFSLTRETNAEAMALESKTMAESIQDTNNISSETLFHDTQGETQTLFGFFASSTSIANIVEAIESKGKSISVAVSIGSINVSNQPTLSGLSELDLTVDADGSFGDIVAFAGSLEKMPQVSELTKVSFFQNNSDPKAPWHLDADLVSYISN